MTRVLVPAAAAFTLMVQSVSATMVVIIGTEERIVVAADSALTHADDTGHVVYTVDGCKLAIDDRLILALAGDGLVVTIRPIESGSS